MHYEEQALFLELGIAGIFTRPIHDVPVPAVLLLHGFGSHKNEVGDLFRKLAASLAAAGIGSLRIDFRGAGESIGSMADLTIGRQLQDAQRALQFLVSHREVDPSRLSILGFSLGAAIAVLTAARQPERFKSMVLWSPAGRLEDDFRQSLGRDAFAHAQTYGTVTVDLGWRTMTLGRSFFDSLAEFDPLRDMALFHGALLTIAGDLDWSVGNAREYVTQAPGEPRRCVIVDGADHIFNVLSGGQTVSGEVRAKTCRWFAETM